MPAPLPPRHRTPARWMAEDAARELPNLPLEALQRGVAQLAHVATVTASLAKLEAMNDDPEVAG